MVSTGDLAGVRCPYCYTEMVSAKGLVMGAKPPWPCWSIPSTIGPLQCNCSVLSLKISRKDPGDSSSDVPFDAVDINMGCPAKKVTSQGAGGACSRIFPGPRQ